MYKNFKLICRVIRCAAVTIFAAFILVGCSTAESPGDSSSGQVESGTTNQGAESVRIFTASDLHYLSPELTDHGAYFTQMITHSDGKTMAYAEELMDAFKDMVIDEKPDALVLTGDLTFNGAEKSHEDLARKLAQIESAGIPVLVLSGNHDLDNANAASFRGNSFTRVDSISPEQFEELYQDFGFSEAVSKDTASSSYVYELKPGIRLLMLDVNGVKEPCHVPEETLSWMENELARAKQDNCRVLSFSHQNLLQHSIFTNGYLIDNSHEVLELFRKYGVEMNFSGHLHIQHMQHQNDSDHFTEITTSALSISPEHYAEIDLKSNSLKYEAKSLDVDGWARKAGSTDENLLHFKKYAEEFFLDSSHEQAVEQLADYDDEERKEKMADYFARENYAYFSGTPMANDPGDAELLNDWKNSGTFLGSYLASFAAETANDYTKAEIND